LPADFRGLALHVRSDRKDDKQEPEECPVLRDGGHHGVPHDRVQ